MRFTTKTLAQGALIAALYTLLTVLIAPISSGLMQCRVSEALCVLPFFTAAAVPGLFIGCVLSNILLGSAIYDIIFGSLATLLAAICTRACRKSVIGQYLAPAPAVLFNALIVGFLLSNVYLVGFPFEVCALYVAIGQILACYGLGLPLLLVLKRFEHKIF